MSAEWRLGRIESVEVGSDGLVRAARVAYKIVDDDVEIVKGGKVAWRHMTVERPIRNMVKLFSIEDTTLIKDMEEVRRLWEEFRKEEAYETIKKDRESASSFYISSEMDEAALGGLNAEEKTNQADDKFINVIKDISNAYSIIDIESSFLL